ncbi:capsid scaffolding protein [Pseudomonas sp. FSL R10-0399]|uniref:GPO family capsid scaffolding protein n=1 Tax=Pseudomonas sp. FSL R10-0399 TaxID=2662194 RepID=UPI0012974F34|nr:GPO family capsid scaffolding protein [Pseudomonas sp. FSL R10-0399]MQT56895.1 capsid scaffolding protein [Pseudomonas sp. FSL R10-0399]
MPRSLVSVWKRVATSGTTADGREILPQELRDIAETYKSSRYTAVIWCEHERWHGSHGTVFSVRLLEDAEDLEPGQIALEAQLKPNDQLLRLNDLGQKLFTSIEITPNFAGSGKAYLTGLAVTDEPASLGTQELYFSCKTNKASYYAASVALGDLVEEEPNGEFTKLAAVFKGLLKHFGVESKPDETPTPTESKIPMDEATAKAAQALIEQLLIVAAGLQTLVPAVTEEVDQTLIDDVQDSVETILDDADKDREMSRRRKGQSALEKRLEEMDKKFTKLLNTAQTRPVARTTGVNTRSNKRRAV